MIQTWMALFKHCKRMPMEIPSLPMKLDSLSESQLQKVNERIQKTVGDEATSCRTVMNCKQRHQYNECSAKNHVDFHFPEHKPTPHWLYNQWCPEILRNMMTTNTNVERHVRIIYWWIKYWRFYLEIANRQSLLLANISSYTVLQ